MLNFIKIWKDGLLLEDFHKGEWRLILSCHGYYDVVKFDGEIRDAYQLAFWLGEYADINKYSYVSIQSCLSGLGGKHSIACKVSRILRNKCVKGYKEEFVGIKLPEEYLQIKRNIKILGRISFEDLLVYKHLVAGKDLIEKRYGYYSVTYRNGVLIKEQLGSA